MSANKCATCIFFEQVQQQGPVMLPAKGDMQKQGWCHRYPPSSHLIVMQNGQGQLQSMHVGTTSAGWCGEYQKET